MTIGYKDKVSKKEFTLKILFLFFDPAKDIHSLSDHQVFLHILSFFMFVACLTHFVSFSLSLRRQLPSFMCTKYENYTVHFIALWRK